MLRLLALSTLLAALAPTTALAGRRAVVVGANDGGGLLEPLRYAEDDAERIAAVLSELGGFDRVDLLRGPDPAKVRSALAGDKRHPDDLVLFYYSGHADAGGLRLGEALYPYEVLKGDLADTPATVRLGILDACRSGAITRKGAAITSSFLNLDTPDATGDAWIAAAAPDEDAQESRALQGSFFTHYLVAGLRGAADAAGDGWVSLAEAYSFARERTIDGTSTTGETQHPTFAFDLQGSADVRLTQVSAAVALLRVPAGTEGLVSVHRLRDGLPVAEVQPSPTQERILALPSDHYLLRRRADGERYEVTAHLEPGGSVTVQRWGTAITDLGRAKGARHGATDIDVGVDPTQRLELSEREGAFLARDVEVLEASVDDLEQRIVVQAAEIGVLRTLDEGMAQATLVHLNALPAAFEITRIEVLLDGVLAWARESREDEPLTELPAAHTLEVLPGEHTVEVRAYLRGRASGPFRYLDSYTIERTERATFHANAGATSTVTLTTDCRSSPMIPFAARPQLRIHQAVATAGVADR